MLTPLRPLLRAGLFLGVFTLWTHSATTQTAHCFNDLSGPEVPCTALSLVGYVSPAPVYQPPSPAELARRRRLAAAHAANERGLKAYKRGDYRTALPYFEKARQLSPNDSTIQSTYWATKGAISYW